MKDSLNDLQNKFENLKQENFQLEQEYFDRLRKYADCIENLELKYQDAINAHAATANQLKESILINNEDKKNIGLLKNNINILENKLTKKEEILNEKNEELKIKDQSIELLKKEKTESENFINAKEKEIKEKNEEILYLNEESKQKEKILNEKNEELKIKDQSIKLLEEEVKLSSQKIISIEENLETNILKIVEKNKLIEELNISFEKNIKDKILIQQDALKIKDQSIELLENDILSKDIEFKTLKKQNEIDNIKIKFMNQEIKNMFDYKLESKEIILKYLSSLIRSRRILYGLLEENIALKNQKIIGFKIGKISDRKKINYPYVQSQALLSNYFMALSKCMEIIKKIK